VLDLRERSPAPVGWQILKQLRRPEDVVAALSRADDAAHDLAVQDQIIGTRRELDQAVRHDVSLSDLS
jgi:hypothetical protein